MSRSLMLLAVAATSMLAARATNAEPELDAAGRTMLNMRVAGAILTSYKEAHGKLPDLGIKLVESSRIVDELGIEMSTDLRRVLAATDGWGASAADLVVDHLTSPRTRVHQK